MDDHLSYSVLEDLELVIQLFYALVLPSVKWE